MQLLAVSNATSIVSVFVKAKSCERVDFCPLNSVRYVAHNLLRCVENSLSYL
jgi:hypothetical protein